MTYIFSNNAATNLLNPIDDVATQLTVVDASLFPSSASPATPCKITLQDADTGAIEICDCTDVSGSVLTVIRGRENTLAISFPTGAIVHHRLTAENLDNFVQDLANVGTGEGEVAQSRVGSTANFKTLKAGSNTTIQNGANEVTIDGQDTASGANLGATVGRQGIYASNTGTQLNLKSLVGGTDIGLTADGNEVTIDYTGTGGGADTFLDLTDTPSDYAGQDGKHVTVSGSSLVFTDPPGGGGELTTGVISGGNLVINDPPDEGSTVEVTAGTGVIVDAYTDPTTPVIQNVSWNGTVVQLPLNKEETHLIVVDATGTVSLVEDELPGIQYKGINNYKLCREKIILAIVNQIGNNVNNVIPYKYIVNTGVHAFYDYYSAVGGAFFPETHTGHYLTTRGNQELFFESRGAGYIFSLNGNYHNDPANPHKVPFDPDGDFTRWEYCNQYGQFFGGSVTSLDPANFCPADTVIPVPGPATAATIQYLFHRVQPIDGPDDILGRNYVVYGTRDFTDIDEASRQVTEVFREIQFGKGINTGHAGNWIVLGAIVLWKGATNFDDTSQARIYQAHRGRFLTPFIKSEAGAVSLAYTDLTDTPTTYSGQQGKLVKVNATEDGLIFGDPSGASVSWGDISGTLSDQTDLQAELDAKEDGLGNPATDGFVLSSTIAGARSWVQGGEVNTYSNASISGVGLTLTKQGVDLPFKNLDVASSYLTIVDDVGNSKVNFDANVGTGAGQLAQGDHLHPGQYEPVDATILREADVDDTPVNGATTDPISSNWAFDHNADPKHLPAAGTISQYIRKQSGTDYDVQWENLKIADDPTPILGGDLDLDGYKILLTNPTDVVEGAIGLLANNTDVFFGHVNADLTYNPADGAVLGQPGRLSLGGSVVEVAAFVGGTDNRDVQVSPEGVLYAAPLPQPGWEVPATSTFDHDFGNGSTQGGWVAVTGLTVNPGDNITTGDRVDAYANLYVENTEDKNGNIEIGIGVNGADPTIAGANSTVGPETITYIPVSWSFVAGADYTTADTFTVFARRAVSVDDAHLYLRGTTQSHNMLLSIPGSGGGGGSPTNLGNIPGASSVTITSSTGANTVLAGATTGPNGAGVMTEAQVASLAGKVDATRQINTTAPLTGGGDLSQDRTLDFDIDILPEGSSVSGLDYVFVYADFDDENRKARVNALPFPQEPNDDDYAYARIGLGTKQWVRSNRTYEQASEPVDWKVGDVWIRDSGSMFINMPA